MVLRRVVSIGIGAGLCLLLAGLWQSAAGGEVEKALQEVRDIKADMFSTKSSVLGELASPAELAAAQPDRLAKFRPTGPIEYKFTDAQRTAYERDYSQPKFKGRPRMSECFPVGITGVHVRDITDRVELVVAAVEDSSPASGQVEVNDIILGANGRLFDDPIDPRPALGYALLYSQTPEFGGKMTLQVVRAGKPLNVTLTLPVRSAPTRSWPYGCPETKKIAAEALRCVLDHAPSGKNLMRGGFWTPLFLMASGDPDALELVTRWACSESRRNDGQITGPGGNNWDMSYHLVNLCEYYELTGDSAVLPRIRWLVKQIELNQYTNLGTWGHGMPTGYGPINNVGLICFMGLILAQESGVPVNQPIMARAIRFFGGFCGTNFGYGEQPPGGRSGRMDNGMNSMAAINFNLLGERQMAQRWGRSVCYMWMGREKGHAERIFPMAWGPLGASLGTPEEFQMHMNNLLWCYELMRTRDGGFMSTDYGSTVRGTFPYPVGSTSAIGLSLWLPDHRLRILGAPRGVFAQTVPHGLEEAAGLYKQKKWSELKALLARQTAGATGAGASYVQGMKVAIEWLEAHQRFALGLIAKNIQANPPLAKEQLAALESLLGQKTPEMAALAAKLPASVGEYTTPRVAVDLKAVVKPQFDLFIK